MKSKPAIKLFLLGALTLSLFMHDPWSVLGSTDGPRPALGTAGYSNLSAALRTIGYSQTTLNIPATWGAIKIMTHTVIPGNVHLRVDKGAYFDISDNITLRIDGTLDAGLYKIFAWSGAGRVVFGNPSSAYSSKVRHVYPEWWGAVGDASTNDLRALNACRDALVDPSGPRNGKGMMHLSSWYAIPDTFSINELGRNNLGNTFTIQGIGKDICGLISNSGCDRKPIMEICGSGNVRCYDFSLAGMTRNCNDSLPHAAPSVGLFMSRTDTGPNGANARFKEFGILGFFRRGCIYNVGYSDSTFEQVFLQPSSMNDGQYMFNVCIANKDSIRPFTDIVPTNGSISKKYGGGENNKFIRLQTGGEYTRSKGSGNACFYFVQQYAYAFNCSLCGNFDYVFYALNAGVYVEHTSGDGGGRVAGIYLCSNSNDQNYPNSNKSVYAVNYTNNTIGGGIPIIKTDAYTNIINSYCNKLRGNNTFTIELGRGLKDSRIFDTFGLRKFKVGIDSSSVFRNNEIDIPYDCQDIAINTFNVAQANKINDLRYTGDHDNIWLGSNNYRLALPGVPCNNIPALFFGKNKITYRSNIPTIGSWVKGDIIFNTWPSAGEAAGWSCILSNTFGILNHSKTTGSIHNNKNILIINDTTGLHIGDVLDVAGAVSVGVVTNINYTTKEVTLDKNASGSVTNAAVSFHNESGENAFKVWANIEK